MWLKGPAWAYLGLSLKFNVPLFSGQKSVLFCTNLWHMILTQFLWTMAGETPLTLPLTRANQGLVRAYPWHGQNSSFLSCNKTVPCWTDSKFWCVHLTKWLGFSNLWLIDSVIPQVLTPSGLGLIMPKKCPFKINTNSHPNLEKFSGFYPSLSTLTPTLKPRIKSQPRPIYYYKTLN